MSRTFRATRFLVPFALLCLAGSARAQSPVTISGQIADSTSKRPLIGAEITVLRDADGTLAGSARAGESGRYNKSNEFVLVYGVSEGNGALFVVPNRTQHLTIG